MKLTDTLGEQAALENLIEESKANVPEECGHLGYLLFTPFRYIPYPFELAISPRRLSRRRVLRFRVT